MPIFDQLFRLRGGALARHYAHHQTMDGVKGDMIPMIALFGVCWIVGIAVSLLFPYECPLLVKLGLSRLRGKRGQDLMQVLGLFACQETVPDHRIVVDSREATRLADATALRDVVSHRDDRARLSLGAKEWRALPL